MLRKAFFRYSLCKTGSLSSSSSMDTSVLLFCPLSHTASVFSILNILFASVSRTETKARSKSTLIFRLPSSSWWIWETDLPTWSLNSSIVNPRSVRMSRTACPIKIPSYSTYPPPFCACPALVFQPVYMVK